ncbi:MAG TPA: DUF4012 domain-containing protein [Candidatus Paceibacterota bacterium]|nr:DUF4012 domain-containing protein [Candidatus Paceibacterota bacterium]
MAEREKKLQSEHAADEIRADELAKITQREKGEHHDHLRDIPVTNHNYWRFRGEERRPLPRGIKWGITGLILLFVGGSVVSYYVARHEASAAIASRLGTLQAGVEDLQNLDPQSAAQEFASLNASSSASGIFGSFISLFAGSTGAIHSFSDLSNQLAALAQNMASVESDAFGFASPNGSSTLTADLASTRTTLAAIDADTNALSGAASYLGTASPISGESYLALKTQVEGAESFLNAFVPWLSDASTTHHILVLFQNPSEMRPGGGFLGSYADVSIKGGVITNVAVHDIADVDSTFTSKIVPPMPLQLEETAFRPADANWFFDFPTSASETIQLFEQSGLYATDASGASTTFDGVIAVTPQVMEDLLSVTGPITLPGAISTKGTATASTTFTSDNLVVQIQKIVQAGQGKSGGGNATYPKEILAQLYPALFQQLASSTDEQKQQILALALSWIANKDVMVYFSNPAFETFANAYGATGDVYELPQNFNGDYLAIANADINSDKSELYVAQDVTYDAAIGSDGTLTDNLTITRTHNGNQSPYWWYQTTNQDYMQIFVPNGNTLNNQSGGIVKNVPAPINYARDGYSTNPFLFAIASTTEQNFSYPKITTHEESGKEVFAVWSRTYAGSSSTLSFNYSHELFAPPASGVQYQFIFERQSGATGNYNIEVDAPLGYVFAENGLASFTYESTSTPGRLMFTLTLQKL